MAKEIERRFIVNDKSEEFQAWIQKNCYKYISIEQGYLSLDPNRIVRIRRHDLHAYLTIKGIQVGASKDEFEYHIPVADTQQLLDMCLAKLSKARYFYYVDPSTTTLKWEIDYFTEKNSGLVLAEIELPCEDYSFCKPSFIGKEVTSDMRFANSSLSTHPFSQWTAEEKAQVEQWKQVREI